MVNLTLSAVVTLLILLGSLCPCTLGKSLVNLRQKSVAPHIQDKVHQAGSTGGFTHAASQAATGMQASGITSPAGIISQGGTSTSFSTSSAVDQNAQDNTSTITSQAMTSNCGAGLVAAQLGGHHSVGLTSIGNCDSIVISN